MEIIRRKTKYFGIAFIVFLWGMRWVMKIYSELYCDRNNDVPV
jgi:hypothetical protein